MEAGLSSRRDCATVLFGQVRSFGSRDYEPQVACGDSQVFGGEEETERV